MPHFICMHGGQSDGGTKQNAEVDTGHRTITFENLKYMYILIKDEKDVIKIGGIQFDAIFSEVIDPHCKQFIMSRFRPGLN